MEHVDLTHIQNCPECLLRLKDFFVTLNCPHFITPQGQAKCIQCHPELKVKIK